MGYIRMMIFSTAAAALMTAGCMTSADKGQDQAPTDELTNAFSAMDSSGGGIGMMGGMEGMGGMGGFRHHGMGGFGPAFDSALALTDSQKTSIHAKLDSIRDRFHEGHHRGDARPSFDSLRIMHKQMRDSAWQAILSVLTDEQKAKADSLRAARDSARTPAALAKTRTAFLKDKLGLDSAQSDSIQTILAAAFAARQAAVESASSFEALHAAVKAIDDKAVADIAATLTPAQLQTFQDMKKSYHGPRHDGRDPSGYRGGREGGHKHGGWHFHW